MGQYMFPYLSPHQSRMCEPTEWEMALARTIEDAFGNSAYELHTLIDALNASRVRPRAGGTWTIETFTATLRELGA